MLNQLLPQFNHFFARLDAGEIVPHARPLARVIAPSIAAALASTQLAIDLKNAPDRKTQKKVLIRDLLAMGGIIVGLIAASRALRWHYGVSNHLHLPGIAHEHAEKAANTAKKILKTSHERITALFKSPKCDHAGEGVVRLQSMAFGGILGGGLGGLLADRINGEDLRRMAGFKLKEGLFQYIGNITFCTVSILAIGKLGRYWAEKYAESILKKGMKTLEVFKEKTEKHLKNLMEKEVGDLNTLPGSASESFETYWLMATKDQRTLRHEFHHLADHAKHQGHENPKALTRLLDQMKTTPIKYSPDTRLFQEGLLRYLNDEFGERLAGRQGNVLLNEISTELLPTLGKLFESGNKKEATRVFREFYTRQIQADLKTVTQEKRHLFDIAKERFAIFGERIGIVAGLFTGIIGGAFASNAINKGLTDVLNLPEGHEVNGLFSGHDQGKGWMEGTVGERGIHWWDAILHLDDWPTALYIAGVHSVESFINVLYGISGMLTGMAGTDYKTPRFQPSQGKNRGFYPNSSGYSPLSRNHRTYSRFLNG